MSYVHLIVVITTLSLGKKQCLWTKVFLMRYRITVLYIWWVAQIFFIGPSGLVHQANKATSEIFLQTLSSTQESNLHPFATKNSIIRNLMSEF